MIRVSSIILGIFSALAVSRPGAAQKLPEVDQNTPMLTRAAPLDSRAVDGVDGFFRDFCSSLENAACGLSGHQTRPPREEPKSSNWLGVWVMPVTEDLAKALNINPPRGVLVLNVDHGSPAAAAGIGPLDVIVSVAGRDITPDGDDFIDMDDWLRGVRKSASGKEIELVVVREGRLQTSKATLPSDQPAPTEGGAKPSLGITLATLTTELRARFGIGDSVRGVLITDVESDCQAARKHLGAGDVIIEVAKAAVRSGDDIREKIDELKKWGKKSAVFWISDRAGERRLVTLAIK